MDALCDVMLSFSRYRLSEFKPALTQYGITPEEETERKEFEAELLQDIGVGSAALLSSPVLPFKCLYRACAAIHRVRVLLGKAHQPPSFRH